MPRHFLLIAISLLAVALPPAWGAEVRNLRLGQEGKKAYLQYDLAGKPGEKEAEVTVSIEIGGERYPAEHLTLTGDLGKKVTVGVGKRIWWDLLKDMPAGFDGDVIWNIEVHPTAEQRAQRTSTQEREKQPEPARPQPLPAAPGPQASLPKPLPDGPKPAAPSPVASENLFLTTNQTVLDVRHRLMWAKLGNDTTEKFTYDQARSYVARMNREAFGGYTDWRLPDDTDVARLYRTVATITAKTGKPAIKVLLHYFPNLENWHYWQDFTTSRLFGRGQSFRRSFDIEDGTPSGHHEKDGLCILPVRTAASPVATPDKERSP